MDTLNKDSIQHLFKRIETLEKSQAEAERLRTPPLTESEADKEPGTPMTEASHTMENLWCYTPEDDKDIMTRLVPDWQGERGAHRLRPGMIFAVSQELQGEDGVLYLQLADGSGWLFDTKPGVGTLCRRQVHSPTRPILKGPPSIRSSHSQATIPSPSMQPDAKDVVKLSNMIGQRFAVLTSILEQLKAEQVSIRQQTEDVQQACSRGIKEVGESCSLEIKDVRQSCSLEIREVREACSQEILNATAGIPVFVSDISKTVEDIGKVSGEQARKAKDEMTALSREFNSKLERLTADFSAQRVGMDVGKVSGEQVRKVQDDMTALSRELNSKLEDLTADFAAQRVGMEYITTLRQEFDQKFEKSRADAAVERTAQASIEKEMLGFRQHIQEELVKQNDSLSVFENEVSKAMKEFNQVSRQQIVKSSEDAKAQFEELKQELLHRFMQLEARCENHHQQIVDLQNEVGSKSSRDATIPLVDGVQSTERQTAQGVTTSDASSFKWVSSGDTEPLPFAAHVMDQRRAPGDPSPSARSTATIGPAHLSTATIVPAQKSETLSEVSSNHVEGSEVEGNMMQTSKAFAPATRVTSIASSEQQYKTPSQVPNNSAPHMSGGSADVGTAGSSQIQRPSWASKLKIQAPTDVNQAASPIQPPFALSGSANLMPSGTSPGIGMSPGSVTVPPATSQPEIRMSGSVNIAFATTQPDLNMSGGNLMVGPGRAKPEIALPGGSLRLPPGRAKTEITWSPGSLRVPPPGKAAPANSMQRAVSVSGVPAPKQNVGVMVATSAPLTPPMQSKTLISARMPTVWDRAVGKQI